MNSCFGFLYIQISVTHIQIVPSLNSLRASKAQKCCSQDCKRDFGSDPSDSRGVVFPFLHCQAKSSASLLWYRLHSSAIPPEIENTSRVNNNSGVTININSKINKLKQNCLVSSSRASSILKSCEEILRYTTVVFIAKLANDNNLNVKVSKLYLNY